MMSSRIDNATRKKIYARDGWRCALCDGTNGLQIHHYIKRSLGGTNTPHNLVTLCSACHSHVHGFPLYETYITPEDIEQAICEYLSDMYAPNWNQYRRGAHPLE